MTSMCLWPFLRSIIRLTYRQEAVEIAQIIQVLTHNLARCVDLEWERTISTGEIHGTEVRALSYISVEERIQVLISPNNRSRIVDVVCYWLKAASDHNITENGRIKDKRM